MTAGKPGIVRPSACRLVCCAASLAEAFIVGNKACSCCSCCAPAEVALVPERTRPRLNCKPIWIACSRESGRTPGTGACFTRLPWYVLLFTWAGAACTPPEADEED